MQNAMRDERLSGMTVAEVFDAAAPGELSVTGLFFASCVAKILGVCVGNSLRMQWGRQSLCRGARRFSFAFFGVNECYRDFSIINHCFLPALYRDHCLRL